MFNKKLLLGLCNIVGVVFILAFLLNITMYVWALFGTPPLQLFDVTNGWASYYIFLNKLVTLLFFYIFAGVMAGLVKSSKLPESFKR